MDNNDTINTVLLTLAVLALLAFMAIWAWIGYLVIRGIRKSTKWVKRTANTVNSFGGNGMTYHQLSKGLVNPRRYQEPGLNPRQRTEVADMLHRPHTVYIEKVTETRSDS